MIIFKRLQWKWALPTCYTLLVIGIYILWQLSLLTLPADQRRLDCLSRNLGCSGLEPVISLILIILIFPSTFLTYPLLGVLAKQTGIPLTESALVMVATPMMTNALLLFLMGSGLDYWGSHRKVSRHLQEGE